MDDSRLNRQSGIGFSLFLALGTLAVLPLLAALVGGVSQRAVRAPIDDLESISVKFASEYREMISAAIEIERLMNVATVAADGLPSLPYEEQTEFELERLERLVEGADYSFLDSATKQKLLEAYGQIEERSRAIVSTVAQAATRNAAVEETLEGIRARAENVERLTRERAAELVDESQRLRAVEGLGSLRFWATTLVQLSNEAVSSTTMANATNAETRFAAGLRSAIFQLSLLPPHPGNPLLAAEFDALFELGRGSGNLFELSYLQFRDRNDIVRSYEGLREDIRAFLGLMDALMISDTELTRLTLETAGQALEVSASALTLTSLLSVAIALLVSWRYVYHRLVRRLRTLTAVTKRLSRGDLEASIEADGDDEITELQKALMVFRSNAKVLEERDRTLAKRSEELELANQELDNFAYVASHDLRAPLRSIDSLASFVLEDVGDDLPEESARHLRLMRQRITRLEALLAGLLEYSRIGRKELAFERVDLMHLVKASADLVIPDDFELTMSGNFPSVTTAKAPLEQVVRNLVDNSVKHHDRKRGVISINGSMDGKEFVLRVADDGPGIEPKYHEKIFGLFQTLKSRDEIEGSGMGLSVLRKSIEHFKGSISVISNPDRCRGTTFTVRWPVATA